MQEIIVSSKQRTDAVIEQQNLYSNSTRQERAQAAIETITWPRECSTVAAKKKLALACPATIHMYQNIGPMIVAASNIQLATNV